MPTFSADQIVGKSLIAKKPLVVYDLPFYMQGAKKIAEVKQGQTAGVVFSYVGGTPGKPLNWEFKGNAGKMYYIPHVSGFFDVGALRQQGVQTTQEVQQEAAEENKSTIDKLLDSLKSSGKIVLFGGLALVALNVILKNRK